MIKNLRRKTLNKILILPNETYLVFVSGKSMFTVNSLNEIYIHIFFFRKDYAKVVLSTLKENMSCFSDVECTVDPHEYVQESKKKSHIVRYMNNAFNLGF